jgi:uncharacterized membrane protein
VLGIDVFLVLSILTCLLDFPVVLQYAYHIAAFAGFGQLWINYAFGLNEEVRFLTFLVYLSIGLANIVFINGYLGFRDRKILQTTSFLCTITIPLLLIGFSAVSTYVDRVVLSLPTLPLIPPQAITAIFFTCAIVLATNLILSMRSPKSHSSTSSETGKEVKS